MNKNKSLDKMTINELLDKSDEVLFSVFHMFDKCDIDRLQDTVLSWHVLENELTTRVPRMDKEQKTAFDDFMTDFNQGLIRIEENCKCIAKTVTRRK